MYRFHLQCIHSGRMRRRGVRLPLFEEKADEDVVILELELLCIHMEG